MHTFTMPAARAARLKIAYNARTVPVRQPMTLVKAGGYRHGDLVLARIVEVGHHTWMEGPTGRHMTLYKGDELLLPCGSRYAPDQFEAELPEDDGLVDLVAKGGLLGKVRSRHASAAAPTRLEPLGMLADPDGRIHNLADYALGALPAPATAPPTFTVVGTSMNSGKTTTAAALIRGLSAAGLRVGAAKLTGTGAASDPGQFTDAGAVRVLDFVDAGHPATYRVPLPELVRIATSLHASLAAEPLDAIVLEIADGVLQPETADLVRHPDMREMVDGYLFAAADSAGALFGVARMTAWGLPVLAASGVMTCSPLAIREAAAELDVPVYPPADLRSPTLAAALLERCGDRAAASVRAAAA